MNLVFLWLATLGFLLTLTTHIGSLFGKIIIAQPLFLAFGLPIVWFPAVLHMTRLVRECKPKNIWKVAFQGTYSWVPGLLGVLFAYTFFNFFIAAGNQSGGQKIQMNDPQGIRVLTGHLMVFYAFAMAIFHSAARTIENDFS